VPRSSEARPPRRPLRGAALAALLCLAIPAHAKAGALGESAARAALEALAGDDGSGARKAVASVLDAHDRRFVAVFIELLRGSEVGIASPAAGRASARALEALTGETHGEDWTAWVEWYEGTGLEPPPGFLGFKGRLLGTIDPRFAELLAPGAPHTIRVEEIVWGGVAYEGIPALDQPETVAADAADWLSPDEPVFGIALGGEARAYPLRILDWHELANDRIGGVAVSLAYCTLCGAGIAWRGVASDGVRYDFGSSGLLMRSNKLMVDRQTRSLWNQFTGRPVVGELAGRDVALERVPMVVSSWKDWRARHPGTRVLSLDTGFERPYHPGAAYAGYFASPETMFPVRKRSRLLPPKERIFGLELGGVPKAYPLEPLLAAGVLHDTLGGERVVLVADGPAIVVDGESVRTGPARYRAGAAVRAYRAGAADLRLSADGEGGLRDAAGQRWRVEEDALVGPDGRRLARIPGVLAYWFGWSAYHPGTRVHGVAAGSPP